MCDQDRSSELITAVDLEQLAEIVDNEVDQFLRREDRAQFRNRVLASALCQGAALHFVDKRNGVKDFDVYTFFRALPDERGPFNRSARKRDFGPSKFGRWPGDDPYYTGRRIDIFWRTIDAEDDMDCAAAIGRYLRFGTPESTPWHLAQKAVVLLRPQSRIGEVIWPQGNISFSDHPRCSE